jgi:hypothetical protein
MGHMRSRTPSPAMIVALTALFLSIAGTSIAASHYLITSTAQIKPNVLRKLRKAGPHGPTGTKGSTGPQGPQGATGPSGPFPVTLPVGQTLTGVYDATSETHTETAASYTDASISFGFRLASPPKTAFIAEGSKPTAECPGTWKEPQAASGWLCVYEEQHSTVAKTQLYGASRYGAYLEIESEKGEADSGYDSIGTWAVTG